MSKNLSKFEKDILSTIKNHFGTDKNYCSNDPFKANIDISLKNDKKLIFFEMKMCEWLLNYSSRNLSPSYSNPENYKNT